MPKIGRLLFLLTLLTGFIIAGIRLRGLAVPFADVALTGIGFFGALALLFGALLVIGKLLGKLTSGRS